MRIADAGMRRNIIERCPDDGGWRAFDYDADARTRRTVTADTAAPVS
ncbi:hypothetical protein BPS26883_01358 [Burkholderia pseudomultivorans]|uniref:Uncharacterized protein n=1 Tax=Burkholderia pseudomultivorans TaxID=1207504 RepID=A0A6P2IMX9_9BURK|nr:hypothetical protein BPS26883_01358 [Burkholderia pseudomultivorans]